MDDYSIYSEIIIILLLIIANGCFSVTETAVISSRSSRLEIMSQKGNAGAQQVLKILTDPSDFLSVIQIGITLIGILTGAFSGLTLAKHLTPFFVEFGFTAKVAHSAALFLVVSIITYLSLVIGELLPKKIAINNPEKIATFAVYPIMAPFFILKPFVKFLSFSSSFLFDFFGIEKTDNFQITEDEFLLTLNNSAKSGVVEETELDIIENILETNDMRVGSIMIPRNMVVWLNTAASLKENFKIIENTTFDCYPLADDDLDNLKGFVFTRELVSYLNKKQPIDLLSICKKPCSLPENMSVLRALLTMSKENCKVAIVIDEFGGIAGIIEPQDIVRCLTGDLEKLRRSEGTPHIIQRNENSWLIDGMLHISELKEFFSVDELPDEERYRYNTFAGFIIALLGHIPEVGEQVTWDAYLMEIMAMDNRRIDMVIVTKYQETFPE